jgi:hypothetical protein
MLTNDDSKYGFCGTTKEFCGDVKVKPPSYVKDGGIINKRVISQEHMAKKLLRYQLIRQRLLRRLVQYTRVWRK